MKSPFAYLQEGYANYPNIQKGYDTNYIINIIDLG